MESWVHGTQQRAHASKKRKPGKKLTPAEKDCYKTLSKIRIRVEHIIRRVKVFRVMGDRYHNLREKYTIINEIVCGLVNDVGTGSK